MIDNTFKYENIAVEIAVVKNKDGNYEYIALDSGGNILENYPVPNKMNNIEINETYSHAVDNSTGIVYSIITLP